MKSYFRLLIGISTLLSCKKEHDSKIDGNNLKKGILTDNINMVRSEINKITLPLEPKVTTGDSIGHKYNVYRVAESISTNCNALATVYCYNCIKTDPPESEITVTVRSSTGSKQKIIDLSINKDKRLVFVNMHD